MISGFCFERANMISVCINDKNILVQRKKQNGIISIIAKSKSNNSIYYFSIAFYTFLERNLYSKAYNPE